jgi:hypothetical protein
MALLAKEAASESLWVAVACIGVALLPVVLLRPQSYEDRLRDEDEDEDEDAAAGDNHSAA